MAMQLTFTSLDVQLQIGSRGCVGIGRHKGGWLGRPFNAVRYSDRKVSNSHCTIIKCADETTVRLLDDGSRNGTYLNGVRVRNDGWGVVISRGDMITLRSPRKPHHVIRITSIRISHPDEPMREWPRTIIDHRAR